MTEIDHVTHGWALLSLKKPEIRALSKHRQSIGEMCECYSLAVLHLRELRKVGCDEERIDEYEQFVSGIEEELECYLSDLGRLPAMCNQTS
jgi:hypothetical protein